MNVHSYSLSRNSNQQVKKPVLVFFLLATALITPFWLLGMTGLQLGHGLPIAALAFPCPMLAAAIMTYRQRGRDGVLTLLRRSLDFRRTTNKSWYALALAFMPLATALSLLLLPVIGKPLPALHVEVLPILSLSVVFFIAALGEELGWSGYALQPLQDRLGALRASLILGLFWAAYHYVGLFQANRSITWIAWWTLATVMTRIIMVWLFNKIGHSVLAMAIFHMTLNTTWQITPVTGSSVDPYPRLMAIILTMFVLIILMTKQLQYHRSFLFAVCCVRLSSEANI